MTVVTLNSIRWQVLGVSLFGELPRGDVLVEHNNFERWDTAMLVLFRIATGEDWQVLMYASYACTYGAGGAIVYYLSFMFFSMFILVRSFGSQAAQRCPYPIAIAIQPKCDSQS
jgi:hypothetical protein